MVYCLRVWQFEAVLKNSFNVRLILKRFGSFVRYFFLAVSGGKSRAKSKLHFDFSFDFLADFISDLIFDCAPQPQCSKVLGSRSETKSNTKPKTKSAMK